jgi:hypothetical protein
MKKLDDQSTSLESNIMSSFDDTHSEMCDNVEDNIKMQKKIDDVSQSLN